MRRLFRWIFNLTAVVSAVLFLATCVLWVRSYWKSDLIAIRLSRPTPPPDPVFRGWDVHYSRELSLRSINGHGWLTLRWGLDLDEAHWGPLTWDTAPPRPGNDWPDDLSLDHSHPVLGFGLLGFNRQNGWSGGPGNGLALCLPAWFAAAILAIAPIRWLAGHRRRRRLSRGQCVHCGYDLRATPERCPECGVKGQTQSPA